MIKRSIIVFILFLLISLVNSSSAFAVCIDPCSLSGSTYCSNTVPGSSCASMFYVDGTCTFVCSTSSCFPAGTEVTMASDEIKLIEDVKVGDAVMSQNENGTTSMSIVSELEQPIRDHMCQINFENGETLQLTSEHPLYTQYGWRAISPEESYKEVPDLPVSQLSKGDIVVRADERIDVVKSYSCISGLQQTYNLVLDGPMHTYFANGYLAHNKCPAECKQASNCGGGSQGGACGTDQYGDTKYWCIPSSCGTSGRQCPAGTTRVNKNPPVYLGHMTSSQCRSETATFWPAVWVPDSSCYETGKEINNNVRTWCPCYAQECKPDPKPMYYCNKATSSCRLTTSAYSTTTACQTSLATNLPGQTTGICYTTQAACSCPPSCARIPSAPILTTPASGTEFDGVTSVDFSWNEPTDWGACDVGVDLKFRMKINYIDGGTVYLNNLFLAQTYVVPNGSFTRTPGNNTFSRPVAINSIDPNKRGVYSWSLQACNEAGCSSYATYRNFNLICGTAPTKPHTPSPSNGASEVPAPITLGWDGPDSWGAACNAPNTNRFTVYSRVKNTATCPVVGLGYNVVPNCSLISAKQCNLTTVRNTSYCWYVVASNGSYSATSNIWSFTTEDPLLEQNWVTTLDGDFYAGSLSMLLPLASEQVSPWQPAYAVYGNEAGLPVASIVDQNVSLESSDSHPQAESSFYVEHANYVTTWPSSYDGNPPSLTTLLPLAGDTCSEIFTNGKLDPSEVYKGDVECIEDGMDAVADNYRLASDGYAVVYVTGSGELNITKEFTTDNDNYRIAFVTGSDVTVKIDRAVGLATDPVEDSQAQIEAAFVVNKNYVVDGTDDEKTSPDKTLVVEGPLVARAIEFNRNRGSTNHFPSEIVRYNSNYIYNLTEQERASDKSNESGLFVIDIDWLGEGQ